GRVDINVTGTGVDVSVTSTDGTQSSITISSSLGHQVLVFIGRESNGIRDILDNLFTVYIQGTRSDINILPHIAGRTERIGIVRAGNNVTGYGDITSERTGT